MGRGRERRGAVRNDMIMQFIARDKHTDSRKCPVACCALTVFTVCVDGLRVVMILIVCLREALILV